ncbi:AAA family ATPase [Streptomonospora salina]|uniref:Uncharacterized protein n=1 Tax=Streptomonospora salina TaxID=104205 RepID=A0A841EFX8_9ACTN|nr:AAA family ATPase [Streptomonospora salina]MBB6000249.1 hypothetical protein [Streptomonospora salina]
MAHIPREDIEAILHEYAAQVRAERHLQARGIAARIIPRSGLALLPEPRPLIEGTIDQHSVVLLAGPWGSGKSFIALDWGARISTGLAWQTRPIQETGTVLYVAAEGAYGLKRRIDAWEYAWRTKLTDDGFMILTRPVNLLSPGEVAELCEQVREHGIAHVIVDTLARCLVGGDENSARDMGMAVDALYEIREATGDGGTVLAIHHTGKDRQTIRGSSALEAGVDTVYQTEGDGRLIQLKRTKRKDGPVDDLVRLSLNPVADSVVVASQNGVGISRSEDTVVSLLHSHFSNLEAPTTRTLMDVSGMPQSSFYRVLNGLVTKGTVVFEKDGRSTRVRLAEDADTRP